MRSHTIGLLVIFLAVGASSVRAENLTVLMSSTDTAPPDQLLERLLFDEVQRCDDRRREAFEKTIVSEAACRDWQRRRREYFLDVIGPLPERTPLNAQIVGELPGPGYRVQKILLETRPGFHLTANFYLPDAPPPWPAVLVPCGHSHEGKAVGQYQLICRLLARHGLAAFSNRDGMPSTWKTVANMSPGPYESPSGCSPLSLERPMTWPIFNPPPIINSGVNTPAIARTLNSMERAILLFFTFAAGGGARK